MCKVTQLMFQVKRDICNGLSLAVFLVLLFSFFVVVEIFIVAVVCLISLK